MKTFKGDLDKFIRMVNYKKPFSFARFSDGEMYIMQNKEVILSPNQIKVGERIYPGGFPEEDRKHFIPDKHQDWKDRLFASYLYKKRGYYKGLPCRCCVGNDNHEWMLDLYGEQDEYMSWSNIFINANYPEFIEKMVPAIMDYKVVVVCNENADLSHAPFNIVRDFRVGTNAMVDDLYIIEKIKDYISNENIREYMFLFAVSSLSNFLAHELWDHCDKNTYLDIGTSLHKYFKLSLARDYLQGYWLGKGGDFANRICVW